MRGFNTITKASNLAGFRAARAWYTSGRTYEAGTLRYAPPGLAMLFLWLLWGDFFFNVFEAMFQFLPLILKELQASNGLIGAINGAIPGILALILVPTVSVWMDRYRSPRGRRIPFLVWSAPGTAICLVGIALSKPVGHTLHKLLGPLGSHVDPNTVALVYTCAVVVLFHFFNMFVCSTTNTLVRDVVPENLMSRFLSMFRVVGTLATFLFARYLFGWGETHRIELFIGVAVGYTLAFQLMCRKVKEGQYPPPPPKVEGQYFITHIRTFFAECLSAPIYRSFYLITVMYALGCCIGTFRIFFLKETLGLSLGQIGVINGWAYLGVAVLMVPAGILCDKIHPMRAYVLSLVIGFPVTLAGYWLIQGYNSLLVMTLVSLPLGAVGQISLTALTMTLFPKDKFAQFFNTYGTVVVAMQIFGGYASGKFIDIMGNNYRHTITWSVVFAILTLVPVLRMYGQWKGLGGEKYVPPEPQTNKIIPQNSIMDVASAAETT